MASLYTRENGVYYLSISFQGKRIIRSLGTRSKSIAMELIPDIERAIYCELLQGRKKRETPLSNLQNYTLLLIIIGNHPLLRYITVCLIIILKEDSLKIKPLEQ